MNKIEKKIEEALTGRFKLAAALQKREQERRAKDEARAAREKQPQQPVKETVEPIDEISTKALQSYRQAAHTQIQHSKFGAGKDKPEAGDVIAKREKGMATATAKVIAKDAANRKPMTSQKTTPYKPLGGRDEKSGRSYSEGVEQMDELSKKTLGSYAVKAKGEMGLSAMAAGAQGARGDTIGKSIDMAHAKKRSKGVDSAIKRLTKEENFKQFRASLIEKTLTPAEMKKREEVAKAIEREKPNMPMGMKMAIATKTAKRVVEEVDDEGKMAKGQLMRMVNQASALAQMMDDDKQLDGWVQSKLTMASDYLDSVHDYLMHNKQDVDEMDEEVDPAHKKILDKEKTSVPKMPKDDYERKVDGYLKKKYKTESVVPDSMKGKQKPYVSSDGKGNHEVLGNSGQTKATFTRKEHGMEAKDKAVAHLKKNYDTYMKEESISETKGAPKGFHFTRDGKLKRGDANQDGDGGPMLRSDPLDKQRSKVPPVSE